MSATMVREEGRVQLEQSDMRLDLSMVKMADEEISHAVIEDTQYILKRPRTEVREEKNRGVEFPGHKQVKAVIEEHPAMVDTNHADKCLPCQNGTAKTLQTHWRCKRTVVPPPESAISLPGIPPPPGTPPVPPSDSEETESDETEGMPSSCVYIHSPLPNTEIFNPNAYAKESKCDNGFIPGLLTAEGTSTG